MGAKPVSRRETREALGGQPPKGPFRTQHSPGAKGESAVLGSTVGLERLHRINIAELLRVEPHHQRLPARAISGGTRVRPKRSLLFNPFVGGRPGDDLFEVACAFASAGDHRRVVRSSSPGASGRFGDLDGDAP